MRYAIVKNNVVVNVSKADKALGENWVLSETAKIGDEWDGETFTTPRDPPKYESAKQARLVMVQWIDGLTAQVMDQYPKAVQARWQIEEEAARAVKRGDATQSETDLVTREGATKGRTPEEHADRIIANADRFRAIADQINTLFLATGAALGQVSDPYQYEAILEAAIEQAAPLAEAYGLENQQ